MKLIYSALDPFQARLISNELNQLGIPAVLFNEHSPSGLGDLPASYPEVWLKRDQDEARALSFIARFEKRLKSQNNQSTSCSSCLEKNPKNFEFCWACQHPLDNG